MAAVIVAMPMPMSVIMAVVMVMMFVPMMIMAMVVRVTVAVSVGLVGRVIVWHEVKLSGFLLLLPLPACGDRENKEKPRRSGAFVEALRLTAPAPFRPAA